MLDPTKSRHLDKPVTVSLESLVPIVTWTQLLDKIGRGGYVPRVKRDASPTVTRDGPWAVSLRRAARIVATTSGSTIDCRVLLSLELLGAPVAHRRYRPT